VLYLDSNVFIYAALNTEDIGDRARALLRRVEQGEEKASSSALTFDEVVWAVKKYRTLDDAVMAGEAFLNFRGLRLVSVDGDLLAVALDLIRRYGLDPRDSIHAASTISGKAEAIVSTDEHFDKVKELQRKTL
jgi:hypothetical protein